MPRPALRDEERDREQEPAVEVAALFEALTAGLPADDAGLDDGQRARRLLAHLLEFHRREDKSAWWELFHRCGFTEEEHVDSRATIGALAYDRDVAEIKKSVVHRYRFPEQTHEIKIGDSPKNPETAESDDLKRGFCGTVVDIDETARTIDLKRGRNSPVPHPTALVPLDIVNDRVLRERLARLAEGVVSTGFAPDGQGRVACDLLRRMPPRLGPPAGHPASGHPPGGTRELGNREPDPRSDEQHGRPFDQSPIRLRQSLDTEPGRPQGSSLVAGGETPLAAVRRIAPLLNGSVLTPGCRTPEQMRLANPFCRFLELASTTSPPEPSARDGRLVDGVLPGREEFVARARELRQRLRSSAESSAAIRGDRDRDTAS